MARVHGKNWHATIDSVSMSTTGQTFNLNVSVDTADVTAAADAAKANLEGDYGWDISLDGVADFGTGLQDITLFGFVGDGTNAFLWNPNTSTTATTNPKYSGNVIMTSYSLSAGVGDAVTYSASFIGDGALSRTVS